MSKVPIRKSVGGRLEPDNDGVNLAQRPYQRMMDEEVNDEGCNQEAEGGVNPVDPGYQYPGRVESLELLICWDVASTGCGRSIPLVTGPADGCPGLLGSS